MVKLQWLLSAGEAPAGAAGAGGGSPVPSLALVPAPPWLWDGSWEANWDGSKREGQGGGSNVETRRVCARERLGLGKFKQMQ